MRFFRSYTLFTFVDVLGTIDSFVAGRTRTSVGTVDRTCVAYSISVTRVGRTRVVQMAQKTCDLQNISCSSLDKNDIIKNNGHLLHIIGEQIFKTEVLQKRQCLQQNKVAIA